jgi:hypothetical protein
MSEGWIIFPSMLTAIPLIGTAVAVVTTVVELRRGREQRRDKVLQWQLEPRSKQAQRRNERSACRAVPATMFER